MFRDRATRRHFCLALLFAVASGTGLYGCRAGTDTAGPSPTGVATSASTAATTTTSTVPPTTVYQASAPLLSRDQAGRHLVAAWMSGDRPTALTGAAPAAVEAVFAQPFPAGGVQERGCASAVAGPSSCVYRIYASGTLLDLSAVAVSGGWIISAARFET
ncbi:MAG: hypothetical protein M3083_07220 [Actinomycetota bacterium]|nr:hypothetical protein [Actinomycetota bacterium]